MRSLILLSGFAAVAAVRRATPSAAARAAAAPRPAAYSSGALPPLNSFIGLEPISAPDTMGLRHCDYVCSVCAAEEGNDDFRERGRRRKRGAAAAGGC